jgi:hypothetical protein
MIARNLADLGHFVSGGEVTVVAGDSFRSAMNPRSIPSAALTVVFLTYILVGIIDTNTEAEWPHHKRDLYLVATMLDTYIPIRMYSSL